MLFLYVETQHATSLHTSYAAALQCSVTFIQCFTVWKAVKA